MKKLAAWLPAAAWMGVIFSMSAMPGEASGAQSGRVVNLILAAYGFFFGAAQPEPETVALVSLLVRKAAHMTEYAVLALLYRQALCRNEAGHPGLTALFLAVLYACTDEYHQAFVPERGPSPMDVAIDAIGASLGLLFGRLISRLRT